MEARRAACSGRWWSEANGRQVVSEKPVSLSLRSQAHEKRHVLARRQNTRSPSQNKKAGCVLCMRTARLEDADFFRELRGVCMATGFAKDAQDGASLRRLRRPDALARAMAAALFGPLFVEAEQSPQYGIWRVLDGPCLLLGRFPHLLVDADRSHTTFRFELATGSPCVSGSNCGKCLDCIKTAGCAASGPAAAVGGGGRATWRQRGLAAWPIAHRGLLPRG